MSVEALILGRDESLAHHYRNILIRDQHSSLLTDLRNELTAAGVDAQWHRQAVAGHRSDIRQRRLEIKVARDQGIRGQQRERQAEPKRPAGHLNCADLHRICLKLMLSSFILLRSHRILIDRWLLTYNRARLP